MISQAAQKSAYKLDHIGPVDNAVVPAGLSAGARRWGLNAVIGRFARMVARALGIKLLPHWQCKERAQSHKQQQRDGRSIGRRPSCGGVRIGPVAMRSSVITIGGYVQRGG